MTQAARHFHAWLTLLLLALAVGAVLYPLLHAGFTGDDWSYLALSLHGDGPLGFFLHEHSYTYLYRPVAMGLWWTSTALFGTTTAAGHYTLNLLLHLGTALLIASLVRAGGGRSLPALTAALLFAVHPLAAGTVAWLSDRFDLLATASVLAALRALLLLPSAPRRACGAVLLFASIAAGSKETAIVLVPVAWLWLWLTPLPSQRRIAAAAATAAPFALFLLARRAVIGSWGGAALDVAPLQAFGSGAVAWLLRLPDALIGVAPGAAAGAALLAGMAVLLAAGLRAASRPARVLLPCCIVLALLTALVQAPVTRLSLLGEAPFAVVTNLRFYYLAGAALAIALALAGQAVWQRLAARTQRPWLALLPGAMGLALLLMLWSPQAWRIAQDWRDSTAGAERVASAAAAVETVRGIAPWPGCVIVLLGAQANEDFSGYIDDLVKAHLPRDAAALDCIVRSERPPWIALTGRDVATPLPQRAIAGGRFGPQPSGRLRFHFPAPQSPAELAAIPGVRVWRYEGGRFVEISAAFVAEPPAEW